MKEVTIWKGGMGNIELLTIARDEGEALNNLIEKEPILAAIGCSVAPFGDVEGCRVVALVPEKFVFGDDRREKEEKARKAAEAKHEKQMKEAQEAEEKKIREFQENAAKEAEEAEAKRKADELKAIDEKNAAECVVVDTQPAEEEEITPPVDEEEEMPPADETDPSDPVEDIIENILE